MSGINENCIKEEQEKKPSKGPLAFAIGNINGRVQVKWKPESFFARNSNLLNNINDNDVVFFSRSTLDASIDLLYGKEFFGYDVSEFFMTFRSRSVWGNTESGAQTTDTELKLLESVFGGHRHTLGRHVLWIREIWLKFCINNALDLHFDNKHFFTLGSFPFELGRGIALGAAFATGPRVLGFYSDNIIDQYAWGYKFSGDFVPNRLSYDLYGAILENKGDSLSNTSLKIRGQEFGRRNHQERGPGKINYLVAGRLKWFPKKTQTALASFEPYALFNSAPEQLIEFLADSSTKLGTMGLAGEFVSGNFELGFDTAVNFGGQSVKGWDRNKIDFENRGGAAVLVNSRVVTEDPNINPKAPKVLFDPNSVNGKEIQRIINTSAQDASQNGQLIGTVGGTQLFNDINRFRNPYFNRFKGWMFVTDAAYWICKPELKIAATIGYATGDENPNKDLTRPNDSNVDGDFEGFIGLQEIYSGNRVQSAFLLGGAGKIPRPLSVPASEDLVDQLPSVISGFTNLVLVGYGLHWYPKQWGRDISVRPNMIFYWQESATKKFDFITGQSSATEFARNYLGFETNVFFDVELFKDLKLFAVGSIFVPGSHFKDIKGTPLSRDQQKILDSLDVTGVVDDIDLPLLSDNVAYTINIGLEYRY